MKRKITKLQLRLEKIDNAMNQVLRGKFKNPEFMIDLLERIKANITPNF